ncbi:hypothetical protein [Prosthecobacter dejongeii]|uniref:hypothetical protein n=1 Tax=Prosthecobacter dejongeii TaxID=48465 RepID=UPI001615D2C0|nr:hypothetical protein [Prosthecobacter dejongeii]
MFVFATAQGGGQPDAELDAEQVFDLWVQAPVVGGVRHRALAFFATAINDTIKTGEGFADYILKNTEGKYWDRLSYWRTTTPKNNDDYLFPSGKDEVVNVRQWVLRQQGGGKVPQTLDDMNLGWKDDGGIPMLVIGPSQGGQWALFARSNEILEASEATISFGPHKEVTVGGLEFGLGDSEVHQMPVEFAYCKVRQAPLQKLAIEPTLVGSFVARSPSVPAEGMTLAIDPRDEGFWNSSPNTRIEVKPDSLIVTNLLTDRGSNLVVSPTATDDRAFLRFRDDLPVALRKGTNWIPGAVFNGRFVPEGRFAVRGVDSSGFRESSRGEPIRLLVGSSPTESIPVKIGDSLMFRPGDAAVLWDEGDPLPEQQNVDPLLNAGQRNGRIHDADSLVTTSWMTVLSDPAEEPGAFTAEAATSPLFVSNKDAAHGFDSFGDLLQRGHVPLGKLHQKGEANPKNATYIPIFPWAGIRGGALEALSGSSRYENSHLSPIRKELVRSGDPIRHRSFLEEQLVREKKVLGVTPQGLIAEVQQKGRGDFSALYFGKGDQDPANLGKEFHIRIGLFDLGEVPEQDKEPYRVIYEDVQRALRAKDLFFVVRKRDKAKKVFRPSTDETKIGEFSFQLEKEPSDHEPILLIKYSRGRSLADLIEDIDSWQCREHLAPVGGSSYETIQKEIKCLAELKSETGGNNSRICSESPRASDPARKAWIERVWNNRDWQGAVLLDVRVGKMPDLFKALGAGIKKIEKFRFHHLGFDFLAVKNQDLSATLDGPNRPGSTFALLKYDGTKEQAPEIGSNDEEPEDPENPPGDKPDYTFKVEDIEVLIGGSEIKRFAASATLGFSRFLWDKTTGDAATKAVELIGSWEARDGADLFKLVTKKGQEKEIKFEDSWFKSLVITNGELSVSPREENGPIKFFIGCDSRLEFDTSKQEFADYIDVRTIELKRAGIAFEYNPDSPTSKKTDCRFRADNASAEIDTRGARNSFLAAFPLKPIGFDFAVDKLLDLDDLGFLKIGGMGKNNFHFGFRLELDLGFLGNLSGSPEGLKLPVILGWKKGGRDFCCGIQFPNYTGEDFKIGLQQFVALKAKKAALKPCRSGGKTAGFAIALQDAQLVTFGKEFPKKAKIGAAIFVPTSGERKVAWLLGLNPSDPDGWIKYIAAGHRYNLPPSENTAKGIVEAVKGKLKLESDSSTGELKSPCDLFKYQDAKDDGWLVVGEFDFDAVKAWFALSDKTGLYALDLEIIKEFKIGAAYRRVNDEVGVFSAELSLAELIPPLQMGVATVRLSSIRTEVYTDGGWLLDLGYPWNRDFRRSFQLEFGIFLGSGGFYFGYTTAAAAEVLKLDSIDGDYGPPDPNDPALKVRALRAGLGLRVGIGRSLDLGILKGEASLTMYASLQGAAAFKPGTKDLSLYAVEGSVGLMVHIWAELDFFVLQARAEIKAYVEVGFKVRRVLGRLVKDGPQIGKHFYLSMPTILIAEVGIYIRIEVWATIGCVRVKIYDLEFKKTWRIEEPFGKLEAEPARRGHLLEADPFNLDSTRREAWTWNQQGGFVNNPSFTSESILIYLMMIPCVASAEDLDLSGKEPYHSCLVSQLMLEEGDGFAKLARYMISWALDLRSDDDLVRYDKVRKRRADLREASFWATTGNLVYQRVADYFQPTFNVEPDPITWPDEKKGQGMVVTPVWPGVSWNFEEGPVRDPLMMSMHEGGVSDASIRQGGDPAKNAFVDFLRLVTESFLEEVDRALRVHFKTTESSFAPPMWREVWDYLNHSAK